MKLIILLSFFCTLANSQFSNETKIQADEIINNSSNDILLNPTDKVDVNYFLGNKALQSTADGELEESLVTTSELSFLSGATSNIQTQLDGKEPLLSGLDGDLFYWNSGLNNLAIGSQGQVMQVSSLGFPEWADLIAVSVTTKGDIQTYSTQPDRLPVGADGYVLSADSNESTGLKWIAPNFYNSPLTTDGDLLYYNSASEQRLGVGSEGQLLTVNSGLPVWQDAPVSGGSAGINFIPDDSFEDEALDPDSDASSTESYQTFTADAELYAIDINEKYFRASYTGLTANDTYVRDSFARTGMNDKQGFFSVWIKADGDDFDLCIRVDDATFTNACEAALKLDIVGDDTWRKYEIPFTFGASTVEYEIFNEAYTGNVDIEVDKLYIGTIPDGYIQKVDGIITKEQNCTTDGSWSTNTSYTCKVARVGNRAVFNIDISFSGDSDATDLSINLPSGLTIDQDAYAGDFNNATKNIGSGAIWDSGTAVFPASVRINNTTSVIVRWHQEQEETQNRTVVQTVNGSNPISTYTSSDKIWVQFTVPITEWTAADTTIVSQNTELTAQTANELSARVLSTGVVDSTNYTFIDGDCTESPTGRYTCDFVSGIFTETPSCTATGRSSGVRIGMKNGSTATEGVFDFRDSSGTLQSAGFEVHCSKQGADVNKSQTIIGKFEGINSSDLLQGEYTRDSAQTVANSGDTTIIYDDFSEGNLTSHYNTSTGVFTSPREQKTLYKVCAGVLYVAESVGNGVVSTLQLKINGVISEKVLQYKEQEATQVININLKGCRDIWLNLNDTLEVAATTNHSSSLEVNANANTNYFSITEQPDTESIIKNLNDNNNLECETKYLSADVMSNTTLADLTFTTEVGKKYSISGMTYFFGGGAAADKRFMVRAVTGSTTLFKSVFRTRSDDAASAVGVVNSCFKAEDTSIFVTSLNKIGDMRIVGNNNSDETFLTLCKLPDNTICN